MAAPPPFWRLRDVPDTRPRLLSLSICWWHSGCCHVLAVGNSPAVGTAVETSSVPSDTHAAAGLPGRLRSCLYFLRRRLTASRRGPNLSHVRQGRPGVPAAPRPCRRLSSLFDETVLSSVRRSPHRGFTSRSPGRHALVCGFPGKAHPGARPVFHCII